MGCTIFLKALFATGLFQDVQPNDAAQFSDGKKLAYDQHYQLAAYQRGLCLRRNRCVNLFVSRTHPGCVAEHVWTEDEIANGEGIFMDALCLWKKLKRYESGFQEAIAA